ncbi:MAG: hypothetical protein AB8B95_11145 [Pseudohongiellaceae bacterium]
MPKKYTLHRALLGFCVACSATPLQAAEDASTDIEMPDLELLEFLGQFATDEGEWLDPDSLLSDEFGELLEDAIEQQQRELERNSDTEGQIN